MSRIRPIESVLVVAACLVFLQACAVSPDRTELASSGKALEALELSKELEGLREGDTAEFRTGLLAKYGPITIGKQYDAASGRSCKQIYDASGTRLLSIACQLPTNQWYVREALHVSDKKTQSMPLGTASKKPLLPVKRQTQTVRSAKKQTPKLKIAKTPKQIPKLKSAKNDVQLTQKVTSHTIEKDETLYSFARRTTGNPLNWEIIAQYNGVTNVHALRPGTALKIPAALQNAER